MVANVSFEYTDQLTLNDVRELVEQTQKWDKERANAKGNLERTKFKVLFKGLANLLKRS